MKMMLKENFPYWYQERGKTPVKLLHTVINYLKNICHKYKK